MADDKKAADPVAPVHAVAASGRDDDPSVVEIVEAPPLATAPLICAPPRAPPA